MAAHIFCLPVPAADSVQHAPAHLQDALQRGRLGEWGLSTAPGTSFHGFLSSWVAWERVPSTPLSVAVWGCCDLSPLFCLAKGRSPLEQPILMPPGEVREV